MDSQTASSESSSTVPQPPSLWKRVAVGVGVCLLCYVVVAYLLVPQLWKMYARHRPSFDDNPRLTKTGDGHPGGPLNVALIGSEKQLRSIMAAAKWYEANPLGVRSDLKIAVDTVISRSYDEAPVSKLYLFGRKEDVAFEQTVDGNPRQRHHVRFWRTKKVTSDGRTIWVGAASYDERVGLSHTTGQITHHIAPDIDTERNHVLATLEKTNELTDTYEVKDFHKVLQGKNGGGDAWHTDGDLWVGVIAVN